MSVIVTGPLVTTGRDAVARAGRQVLQALVPTLLLIVGGTGLDRISVRDVAILAAVTGLVSLLKSAASFTLPPGAPVPAQLAERAVIAAAGTALGYVVVDSASAVDWSAAWQASFGAALLAVVMFFTNPPVLQRTDVGPAA